MEQNTKKLVPCIYLYQGSAVRGFSDHTIVSMKPEELAVHYCNNSADALLIFDLSTGDKEHEENLNVIKTICTMVDIPVTGAGNVHRMEDIKKLLYAGCSKAALNYSREENIEITEEVSLKFGEEKIAVCIKGKDDLLGHEALLEQFVSELILVSPYANSESIRDCLTKSSLPLLPCVQEIPLEKLLGLLSMEGVSGVSGDVINHNAKEIQSLKTLCDGAGIPVSTLKAHIAWEQFKKNSDGMVPVVVQDEKTDQVLMVAYMNEEAYDNTVRTGKMTYYSRSRNELWVKGETSGHYQYVRSLTADCDLDTILARVTQVGAACHTGSHSCFFNPVLERDSMQYDNPLKVFEKVMSVIHDRKLHPKEGSYTNYLFDKGIDKILKKLGEEATEIVIAAKNPDANEIKYEIADFLYHMMVLMEEKGVSWEEITEELAKRQ